ncbi:hypothetical protein BAUCODRAFT_434874 [Baudoinia panamericana UAMH 10762]|uniref:Uncharacterized protein n=1 Tax=Baudoinia panamericana (strain UAMH 10762) TaxID=717646 RepID=M2MJX0_BAUPA|nr:uncharacterized protein BAUCODRAFT_434874 [Baudoinia panamericana UAMH 10762]EMC96981.1 hypothetical protein BAUCODRAFT_434874 [Baudoinia panamericana UAMH 10762]
MEPPCTRRCTYIKDVVVLSKACLGSDAPTVRFHSIVTAGGDGTGWSAKYGHGSPPGCRKSAEAAMASCMEYRAGNV